MIDEKKPDSGEADAPYVLIGVDDLFFVAKIEGAARRIALPLVAAQDADQLMRRLVPPLPRLIILDLNSTACKPLESVRRIKKRSELREIPVLGFYSHVQTELARAAEEAGFDQILPRSRFSAELVSILQQGLPPVSGGNPSGKT